MFKNTNLFYFQKRVIGNMREESVLSIEFVESNRCRDNRIIHKKTVGIDQCSNAHYNFIALIIMELNLELSISDARSYSTYEQLQRHISQKMPNDVIHITYANSILSNVVNLKMTMIHCNFKRIFKIITL